MTNALTQARVEQSSQPARSPQAKEDQVMRQIIATAAAALAVVTAVPAMARDTAPAPSNPASSTETPAPKANTRYCVTDKTTGSRLARKTCKTRADWIAYNNFDPLAPQR